MASDPRGQVGTPPCDSCAQAPICSSYMLACYCYAKYVMDCGPEILPYRKQPLKPNRAVYAYLYRG